MRFAFASKIPATKSSPPHKDTNDAQSASARGSKCFPLKSSAARNPKIFLKDFLKEKMAETPSFFVPPVRKMLSSHTFQISRRWHTQPPLPARGPGEAQRRATRWHFSEVRVPVAKGGTVCRYASHNKFPALNVQFNSLKTLKKNHSI